MSEQTINYKKIIFKKKFMKKIIIWMVTLFILTSCNSNSEDIKKIANLEKEIQENNIKEKEFIFKKKKECFDLCSKIYKDHNVENDLSYFNPIFFYSKQNNSCYYEWGNVKKDWIERIVQNCLSNEIELIYIVSNNKEFGISSTEFEKKLKELKN